jgi:hypothetical protein
MNALILSLAAAAELMGFVSAQNISAEAANLENYWSYGRSEPVYPTRKSIAAGYNLN